MNWDRTTVGESEQCKREAHSPFYESVLGEGCQVGYISYFYIDVSNTYFYMYHKHTFYTLLIAYDACFSYVSFTNIIYFI
jgi:hypothetical protein